MCFVIMFGNYFYLLYIYYAILFSVLCYFFSGTIKDVYIIYGLISWALSPPPLHPLCRAICFKILNLTAKCIKTPRNLKCDYKFQNVVAKFENMMVNFKNCLQFFEI